MDSVLSAAEKLFLRGKYAKVLRLLEPQVFQYRESYRFYLLLGYSCLHTGDFGGGFSYLRRAEQISTNDTGANLGIALVLAKRGETEEAIRIWLDILERKGESKEAQRGLKLIRESDEFSQISMKLEEDKLDRYLSYPRRKHPVRTIGIILLLLLCVALAGIIIQFDLYKLNSSITSKRPELQGIEFFSDGEETKENTAEYYMSEPEIKNTTETILDLMNDYRDNLARREINRLLLSNASEEIKTKARYLTGYIKEPSFATLKDSFSFTEVSRDPLLYEGCYVIWRGRSANIEIRDDEIVFDFLVGYEDETLLEGIVPVRLDFALSVEENKRMEILGKIHIQKQDETSRPKFELHAISAHQLLK